MMHDESDLDLPRFHPRSEAILQEEIDLALAPYKDRAPPALLKMMREALEEGLRTHPLPVALLHRMSGQAVPAQQSGAVLKDGMVVEQSGAVHKNGAAEDDEAGGKGEVS
ncbi:MAG: hypothetical protein ACMG6S_35740 [Byssovorax sp.]